MSYMDFLKSKMAISTESGFEIDVNELNPNLLPHQKDIIAWAIRGGRRAVFARFGLGKTVIQIEFIHHVLKREGGKGLIIMPLGVRQEFTHDAVEILHYPAPEYVRNMKEVKAAKTDIVITNYERVRDGDIDPNYFTASSLDEAAVLRSYGSETTQAMVRRFSTVPYKMIATATPDPNKYEELLNYAVYLGVMDKAQARTRFFQRDSTKARNLTLYPHKEEEFWLWVSSWAVFVQKPSDVNSEYSDSGYDLPPLKINYHRLETKRDELTADRDGQLMLFEEASASLQDGARIKRDSIKQRVQKAAEIIAENPNEHYVLWHDLEEERHEIKRQIPKAVDIYGSMDYDLREKRVIDFAEGKIQIFSTKKVLSGSGCNFQKYCHRAIFVGIDYKFNDFIQAVHRIYRYLQPNDVVIDIIYTDEESEIIKELLAKWERFDYQSAKMAEIIKQNGLSSTAGIVEKLKRSIGVNRVLVEGKHFKYINNDCILELEDMQENSVDEIITSIPFGNHYEYTPSYNDLGHNEDNDRFFEQMDYLTPNLLRVLKPGRVACIHVKDRILFGNCTGDGMQTVDPFSDLTVMHFMKHGFRYMGRITITTDVVRENNQTYRLGWTEQCKDGSKMGVGLPEYVLLFRKLPTDTSKGYADEKVVKSKEEYSRGRWQIDAHAFWRSSGDRLVSKEEIEKATAKTLQKVYTKYSRNNVYSFEEHRKLAEKLDAEHKLPATFMVIAPASWNDRVWDDIVRIRTLNTEQRRKDITMHVCPLQLDIIERLITRYSNKGDIILDPFGGIGSTPMTAIKMGRYGIGIELNNEYFRDGVGYCKAADEEKIEVPTLFDYMGVSV